MHFQIRDLWPTILGAIFRFSVRGLRTGNRDLCSTRTRQKVVAPTWVRLFKSSYVAKILSQIFFQRQTLNLCKLVGLSIDTMPCSALTHYPILQCRYALSGFNRADVPQMVLLATSTDKRHYRAGDELTCTGTRKPLSGPGCPERRIV